MLLIKFRLISFLVAKGLLYLIRFLLKLKGQPYLIVTSSTTPRQLIQQPQ